MPHTWIEVALNPERVRSPNWYTRAVTAYGVDVTASQFDVTSRCAGSPLTIWPAGSPPFEIVAPLPVARGGRLSSTREGWDRGGGGGAWEGLTAPLEDYELFLRQELEATGDPGGDVRLAEDVANAVWREFFYPRKT